MYKSILWLGSQDSYDASVVALNKGEILGMEKNQIVAALSDNPDLARMVYDKQNGVAIITVSGSLVDGNVGYGLYFGVTGYGDIRDALAMAVTDPSVGSILLNVKSGGGQVDGVSETAALIRRVDKVKPVVTYSGSRMASAALWIGASARYSVVGETSLVGSIGTMITHVERSKQLAADGITPTVIRSGDSKALATAVEPLSQKAKDQLQAQADTLSNIFLGYMADARGVTKSVADGKFGQGREFIGQQAVDVGLVDKVGTFEDAFAKAASLADKAKARAQASNFKAESSNSGTVQASTLPGAGVLADNSPNSQGTPMPKPLSQEHLEALAAGVDLDAEDKETTGTTASTTETTTPAVPAATENSTDTLTVLQKMVSDANVAAAAATAEAVAAKAELDANKVQLNAALDIVRVSVKNMSVPLNQTVDTATMSASEVLAEHARLSVEYRKKMKVGGVAATAASEDAPKPTARVSPMFAALVSK